MDGSRKRYSHLSADQDVLTIQALDHHHYSDNNHDKKKDSGGVWFSRREEQIKGKSIT